ncbi:MAG: adenine phosphoribosyltransferase [Bacteroidales bacterium]|nr:adenine phosphoribosyltransferase [Bacteroidales bacterium]MBN2819551.1 adenine phosphoribosyltransferase [Bacteroidales bacterium]
MTIEELKKAIRNVPDYPKKGIQFKDLTTLIKVPEYFQYIIDELAVMYSGREITKVVGIESRGFIFGGALASALGAGFVPIRKAGKLPADCYTVSYILEYGKDSIEIHKDAIEPGETILLHDDLLATGGTSKAAIELLKNFKPEEIYLNYIVELNFLEGRKAIGDEYDISALLHF